MKKLAVSLAALAAAAFGLPALAHAEPYAGVGYTWYDAEGDDVGGITGRLGYRFTPHLAVEGEGTLGVDDNDGAELNHALGIYGVGTIPVGSSLDVHGRVGYNHLDIARSNGPDINDGGLSYGAGVG